MRCPKCGYISFDHLDRCNRCRTDLTGERSRLNLLEIKPNPISLQAIRDRIPQISSPETGWKREETQAKGKKSVVPEAPGPTLGEGFSLSLDDSISLDLDSISQKSKRSPQEEDEIELFMEGMELIPSPKKGD